MQELDDIFANAPAATTSAKRERKPLDEDDCPICYSELESLEGSVYCAARCGTNLHKACFEQWAATFEKSGKPLTVRFPTSPHHPPILYLLGYIQ